MQYDVNNNWPQRRKTTNSEYSKIITEILETVIGTWDGFSDGASQADTEFPKNSMCSK